ncbi:Methyltransferase-like protein 7b [Lasiodiplodia theobromae]|uniref:Methyltransferase-like protein 7b n=1 Tax=Lasiodiplodia theobromae TaxID=45133 RepID=UPI0015C2F3FC|nr:Methyltransferase-like protein 7b [Lasiodiplodia theobromae]KAF4537810.1 Methyltransferase-like protein 7b [Lasiodiplodia theobromae]
MVTSLPSTTLPTYQPSCTADGFIAFEGTTCVPSLVLAAHGKILELGPGPGNQLQRFDPSRVDFIYAVEPNAQYADHIAAKLKRLDLQDKYKLLACGVEDSDILRSEGVTEGSMDTVLSIQVLCSVGDVKSVMREVWKLLKPGGSFVFWEHVKNKDTATAIAQACLNPAWSTFVGCHLTRHIKEDILAAGEWENPDDIQVAHDPFTCLPRIWGDLKKKA